MNINWQVRIRNKAFWLAFIPALIVLVQAIGAPFGFRWDFGILNDQLKEIVEAVFVLLALLGIVNDPTTVGLSDSARALGYTEPNDDTVGLR